MHLLHSFVESAPLSRRLRAWLESLTPAQLAVLEQVQSTVQLIAFVELWREVGEVPGSSAPSALADRESCACGRCLAPSQERLLSVITSLFRGLAASLSPPQRAILRERIAAAEWEGVERQGTLPPVGQA